MKNDKILQALTRARDFIEGFDGDDCQEPGSIESLLKELDEALAAERAGAEVILYVKGGTVQGARSTAPCVSLEVFDEDNLERQTAAECAAQGWEFGAGESFDGFWDRVITPKYPHAIY